MNRRRWLAGTTTAALSTLASPASVVFGDQKEPLPIAAVVTEYRKNSHADVIVGKVLQGFNQQGGPGPKLRLVSLFTDQVPNNDLSRELARKHGFRIADTIPEALTLGSNELQVQGVLSIGEHGKYPKDERTGQTRYPRRRFFDAIVDTMQRSQRFVPIFSDKHLAANWTDAKAMYDRAIQHRIPFMAGSSLPVTWRRPPPQLPIGSPIEAAVAVGYGGLEAYGFHALETLQCMIERRQQGESGVAEVQTVRGDAIVAAARQRAWFPQLLESALKTMPGTDAANATRRIADNDKGAMFLLKYRDGFPAVVAMANGVAGHFAIALKLKGRQQPVAAWFELDGARPYRHFEYLLRAVDSMFQTGQAAYPVERTLLTTGTLHELMLSAADGGAARATPHLDVGYTPTDWPYAR